MRFGTKSEPKKCSRCFRTKEEAVREQKEKGAVCSDPNCTFKLLIRQAINGSSRIDSNQKTFVWQFCPKCGRKYYGTNSKYCSYCGRMRK